MNPWGFVVIGLGILLIIMGVKGSYENVVSALTGRQHSVPGASSGSSSSASANASPYMPVPAQFRPRMY